MRATRAGALRGAREKENLIKSFAPNGWSQPTEQPSDAQTHEGSEERTKPADFSRGYLPPSNHHGHRNCRCGRSSTGTLTIFVGSRSPLVNQNLYFASLFRPIDQRTATLARIVSLPSLFKWETARVPSARHDQPGCKSDQRDPC